MIDKELIELQKGCVATCVVIQNEDIKELKAKIVINSDISENELIDIIKNGVVNNNNNNELNYIIISNIDNIDQISQKKYYQIVKDREFYGYQLPCEIVIVLTVSSRERLKNIAKELYKFCVVAFY